MKNNKNQQVLIGGAVVFRDHRGKRQWLVAKPTSESDWEIPKTTVRRGESSVRAVIRLTGEQGGMTARVLEEAGRATGTVAMNGKTVNQKYYYYLMFQKAGVEDIVGLGEYKWMEFAKAEKSLSLKREKDMLKGGRDVLKEWEKTHKLK